MDIFSKNHTVNVTRVIHIPMPAPEEAAAREKFLKDLETAKDPVDYDALDKLIKKIREKNMLLYERRDLLWINQMSMHGFPRNSMLIIVKLVH